MLSIALLSCKEEIEKVVEKYENGKPKIIFILQNENDSLNYQKKVLYNSGKVNYLGQYIDGNKSGVWTWWYENGNKKDQCKYDDGSRIDTVFHWYESGRLKQIQILPGEKIPEDKCCDCNGTIIQYFDNGEWNIKTYKNDSLNGPTVEHNIDSGGNVVIAVGQYRNDKETGFWQWFDKDSVLTQTAYYENGVTSGLHRTYHSNGTIASEGFLKNGQYHGLVIYYDNRGKIVNKKYYKPAL